MPTRFYLPISGAAAQSPAVDAAWEGSRTGFARYPARTTKSNTALTDLAGQFPSISTQQICWGQWVSDTLAVDQTISGTVSIVVRGLEAAAGVDGHLAYSIRVIKPDGTARGTLLLHHTQTTEFTTSAETRIGNAQAVTTVAALAGDRIVIEIGVHGVTPLTGTDATLRFGDPTGTADFALTSGLTTDLVPWVELSAALILGTVPVVTVTDPADLSQFGQGEIIGFAGTAEDLEDGSIGSELVWSSNLDGAFGSGDFFEYYTLGVGVHTITAKVTDSSGLKGSDSITVTVNAAVLPVRNRDTRPRVYIYGTAAHSANNLAWSHPVWKKRAADGGFLLHPLLVYDVGLVDNTGVRYNPPGTGTTYPTPANSPAGCARQFMNWLEYSYRDSLGRTPGNDYWVSIEGVGAINHDNRTLDRGPISPQFGAWPDRLPTLAGTNQAAGTSHWYHALGSAALRADLDAMWEAMYDLLSAAGWSFPQMFMQDSEPNTGITTWGFLPGIDNALPASTGWWGAEFIADPRYAVELVDSVGGHTCSDILASPLDEYGAPFTPNTAADIYSQGDGGKLIRFFFHWTKALQAGALHRDFTQTLVARIAAENNPAYPSAPLVCNYDYFSTAAGAKVLQSRPDVYFDRHWDNPNDAEHVVCYGPFASMFSGYSIATWLAQPEIIAYGGLAGATDEESVVNILVALHKHRLFRAAERARANGKMLICQISSTDYVWHADTGTVTTMTMPASAYKRIVQFAVSQGCTKLAIWWSRDAGLTAQARTDLVNLIEFFDTLTNQARRTTRSKIIMKIENESYSTPAGTANVTSSSPAAVATLYDTIEALVSAVPTGIFIPFAEAAGERTLSCDLYPIVADASPDGKTARHDVYIVSNAQVDGGNKVKAEKLGQLASTGGAEAVSGGRATHAWCKSAVWTGTGLGGARGFECMAFPDSGGGAGSPAGMCVRDVGNYRGLFVVPGKGASGGATGVSLRHRRWG